MLKYYIQPSNDFLSEECIGHSSGHKRSTLYGISINKNDMHVCMHLYPIHVSHKQQLIMSHFTCFVTTCSSKKHADLFTKVQ